MHKRKYLSGAQKRKKNEQKRNTERSNFTLFNVGFQRYDLELNTINSLDGQNDEASGDINSIFDIPETTNPDDSVTNIDNTTIAIEEGLSTNDGSSSIDKIENTCTKIRSTNDLPVGSIRFVRYDIGNIIHETPISVEVEMAVRSGPTTHPTHFPKDIKNCSFPMYILQCRQKNGDVTCRDWLVWSESKEALFCFPCRLFGCPGRLSSLNGWSRTFGWKKLYDRVPEHELSIIHRQNYLKWRELELCLTGEKSVDSQIEKQIQSRMQTWRDILKRIIDVILFLSERSLAFRGTSQRVCDPNNGNFLGILNLLGHYDPLLRTHLEKVDASQKAEKRMSAHYLSSDSQNELISACANQVLLAILNELRSAKYFSIIVDATPDSSHTEQTSFIIRYVSIPQDNVGYIIHERFLAFVDCYEKTGVAIANLIIKVLSDNSIPICDCRGQGYDNGSNMAGKYNGAQAHILKINHFALFSPCACHSLNLCGSQAAECCPQVQTFFGIIQKLYNIFSCSPMRWKILQEKCGLSLHNLSTTRWSDRVNSVRPFVSHIDGIKAALNSLLDELNLTTETKVEIQAVSKYVGTFICILMSCIWVKVLGAIDLRNKILQARNATLDVEVKNIDCLLDDLLYLREGWPSILNEARIVANGFGISTEFPRKRKIKRKKFADEIAIEGEEISEETKFRLEVFYKLIDSVITGLKTRYEATLQICSLFTFFWQYLELTEEELELRAKSFIKHYNLDVSEELIQEVKHLRRIHSANFGEESLCPIDLLNKLYNYKLVPLFPNCCVALRIFCSIPATVAEAERSFSKLNIIKNYLRSTMTQERLTTLAMLSIENQLAQTLNFDDIIDKFAHQKARKAQFL